MEEFETALLTWEKYEPTCPIVLFLDDLNFQNCTERGNLILVKAHKLRKINLLWLSNWISPDFLLLALSV